MKCCEYDSQLQFFTVGNNVTINRILSSTWYNSKIGSVILVPFLSQKQAIVKHNYFKLCYFNISTWAAEFECYLFEIAIPFFCNFSITQCHQFLAFLYIGKLYCSSDTMLFGQKSIGQTSFSRHNGDASWSKHQNQ